MKMMVETEKKNYLFIIIANWSFFLLNELMMTENSHTQAESERNKQKDMHDETNYGD